MMRMTITVKQLKCFTLGGKIRMHLCIALFIYLYAISAVWMLDKARLNSHEHVLVLCKFSVIPVHPP